MFPMLERALHSKKAADKAAEPLARNADFDLALVDINVGGNYITPIAKIIADRGLPFIFVSGYGSEGRPLSFHDSQHCESRS